MMWTSDIAELLWRGAWAVIPLTLLVAAICRWAPCRPVTRHSLWVIVLVAFLAPLLAPVLPLPRLLPSTDARPSEDQVRLAPACEPIVVVPYEGERDIAAPSSQVPATLLLGLAGGPHLVRDTADAAVPPSATTADPAVPHSTSLHVLHGRVGPERDETALACPSATPTRTDRAVALSSPDSAPVAPPLSAEAGAASSAELSETAADSAEPRSTTWKDWAVALAAVRDALVNLPMLPTGLWLAGIGVLIAIYAGGAVRFRRRLHRAAHAPKSVQRMVVRTARRFGLRRVPETLVLDEPISPMVWGGGRVRLVLPTGLWSQLDQVGRQAILCHELAHLRRRDHWLRWLELLTSAVFWWHPLVWWVRRRMHEEADLCCDAWVTWLMPRRRRAYAEALLAAREHMGAGRRLTPAVAVGVTTSGAKRFTRRITMVMTHSSRPGISLAGIGLACALLLVGWVTTPAWSTPPKDTADVTCKTVVVKDAAAPDCCPKDAKECVAKCEVRVRKGDAAAGCDPKCEKRCKTIVLGGNAAGACDPASGERRVIVRTLDEEDGDANPFGLFYSMAGGDDDEKTIRFLHQLGGSDDDDLEQRLAKLEQAVQQLNMLLGAKAVDICIPAPPAPPAPPCPPAPPAPPKPYTWHTQQGKTFKIGDDTLSIAIGAPSAAFDTGEKVVKAYKLPKGKLEALTALMVRQDVPVLVSPKEDCIEVHGTPRAHKIFKAFVDLIHPEGKKSAKGSDSIARAYALGIDGTDLSELLDAHVSLDDLTGLEHLEAIKVYKDALGKLGECEITVPEIKVEVIGELENLENLEEQQEQSQQLRKQAEEWCAQAKVFRDGAKVYRQHAETGELRRAIEELQREAKRLQELAEQLRERAEHPEH